ncbi:MAG: hypothetical protein ACJ74U_06515 [Jatrophihabitantaceae bacterium]
MWRLPAVARRAGVLLALAGTLTLSVPAGQLAGADSGSRPPVGGGHDGYYWISYFRMLGGLGPVSRDAGWETQEAAHVRYLADHALSCETDVHDELTSRQAGCGANPYATPAGRLAANNSDITRMTGPVEDRAAVRNWFVAGFHALTLLDPRLRSTGYSAYYTASPAGRGMLPYQFTAAVDVYRGRTGSYSGGLLSFPATGATSPLLAYRVGTESPEPFGATLASSPCHAWTALSVVSAPIIVQWPVGSRRPQTPAAIVDLGSGRALPTCALTASQYPAGSLPATLLIGTNRVTRAALYYADAPFQPAHRYQLRIGGTVITEFGTSN